MGQNSITRGETEVKKPVRAKYYRQPDGSLRLASIERASRAIFTADGWEDAGEWEHEKAERNKKDATDPEDRARAIRRASLRAMDIVACNNFELFTTLTIDPERMDRTSYHDIERYFSAWASNGVQRRGLRYIAVPEYHHDGQAIHLHMLCNDVMPRADSGVEHHGRPVYNLSTWRAGFSTAQLIAGESAEIACAKYVLKYMRKQQGQKIGGRYFLTGGTLERPVYVLGDSIDELQGDNVPTWCNKTAGGWGEYWRYSYV